VAFGVVGVCVVGVVLLAFAESGRATRRWTLEQRSSWCCGRWSSGRSFRYVYFRIID
jgi:hypothetical protein